MRNRLRLTFSQIQDVINILNGVYAPLFGFLGKRDFELVLSEMRLASGEVWPIPVVLDINKEDYNRLKKYDSVILLDNYDQELAYLEDIEIYSYNKEKYAQNVFGTISQKHPGVFDLYQKKEYLLGGRLRAMKKKTTPPPVSATQTPPPTKEPTPPSLPAAMTQTVQKLSSRPSGALAKRVEGSLKDGKWNKHKAFTFKGFLANARNDNFRTVWINRIIDDLIFTPKQSKRAFRRMGWRTIVAFQTRNVPHRSHEFLQKQALKNVDGLFVQPIIGPKKPGDFQDEVILGAYKILLEKYYPYDRALLGVLPARMHYAGPREAVMHALIRRNYGCTHIIIGRDHAGVGNYYGPYDAHNIFNQFNKNEIGIEVLKYDNVNYCRECQEFVSSKICQHDATKKLTLSGTKVREMIKNKRKILPEFIRPEVLEFLFNHPNPFV